MLFQFFLISSIILWLLPPIRQFRSDYFYFFIIIALTDPITHVLRWYFYSGTNIQIIILQIALVFSLFQPEILKKYIIAVIIFAVVILSLSVLKPTEMIDLYLIIFINASIFIIFLKRALVNIINKKEINIFHFALLFYEMIVITKLLNVILQFANALYYFYISTIFQYLLAVFFFMLREDNRKIIFPLKSLQAIEE
jgi:hypothetical protein